MKSDELLKKSLEYLVSIKKGDHRLILLIDDIKKHLNPIPIEYVTVSCHNCGGTGEIAYADGHDCWGKTDYSYKTCPSCNGSGYVKHKKP